jgi:hypothetical protein
MKRRSLLIMLLLSGCVAKTSPNPVPTVHTLASDIDLATSGAKPLVNFVSTQSGVDNSIRTEIKDLFQILQDDVTAIHQDITKDLSSPTVKEAVDALNAIIDVAAAMPIIPEPYSAILQALVVLLPIIEAEAGIASAPKPANVIVPATMTADSARLILRSAAVTN